MPFDFAESDIRDDAGQYLAGHTKPGPGRSTKYCESHNRIAHMLAQKGSTDQEIAWALDISQSTFYNWRKRHPAFLESLKAGKCVADGEVAQALYKLATGYDYTEERLITQAGKPTIIKVGKHRLPCIKAIIFWLCNRQPDKWRR